jgi:hypothetical protein
VAWIAVRSQLWTVARPGDAPEALRLKADHDRTAAEFDVTLPAVPVGMVHLESGRGVLLIHYWAPWEHAGRAQVALLDSLRQLPEMQGLRVVVVCFDPFPSVARFVARQRLRLNVLIDSRAALRATLPCPSVPYTYVLDGVGRLAVSQSGEVDWLSAGTRATLAALLAEPTAPPATARPRS